MWRCESRGQSSAISSSPYEATLFTHLGHHSIFMSTDTTSTNYDIFRECLLAAVVESLTPVARGKPNRRASSKDVQRQRDEIPDLTGLEEFAEFIADDCYDSLPDALKKLSHENTDDKYTLPLSLSTIEGLAEGVPPSVTDSLTSYGLISPPRSDTQTFLVPILNAYIKAVTTPPPKWIETRTTACEICERDWIPLSYHHLIPRQTHAKVLKRGLHPEAQLNSVAWLCRACHSFVHHMASNDELAKSYYTVDLICERDDVQKFAQWVGRVRWKKR